MADLRIFSYLPNPRVWKSTIAARFCDVTIELRGAPSGELKTWLWDFDARPLSEAELLSATDLARAGTTGFIDTILYKTDAFIQSHPFGTVPAAFSPDGLTGIFESNSIMRAVARIGVADHALYGTNPYEASRIDSFLDSSLVFARDTQIYLLALLGPSLEPTVHARAKQAFHIYLTAIETALAPDRAFLVANDISLADICFAMEIALFKNERSRTARLAEHGLPMIFHDGIFQEYPLAFAHFDRLKAHRHFRPELDLYLAKQARAEERG